MTFDADVPSVLDWLRRRGKKKIRDEMGPRYGVRTDKAFGVPMADMLALAKRLGTNHELAGALWATGCYEARMVASLVDDPARVTASQMDRWCADFDNWGICDTVCFKLFDRTPHAWKKVAQWARRRDEFVKRAAFALLASLALHDRESVDAPFMASLRIVERAATDERNFVKKSVNWALRSIGERNAALNRAALAVARRLATSPQPAPRWVGKDAMRQLASPAVKRRLTARGTYG